MEQLILRRIVGGDEKLFFLTNKNLFLNPLSKKLLTYIGKFYQEFLKFPSEQELMFKHQSSDLGHFLENILALPIEENLSAEYLAYELKNQAARNTFADSMLNLSKEVPELDYNELSDQLYTCSLNIRELSESHETIFNPADLPIDDPSEIVKRLPSGLDKFDTINGGFSPGELILIGGRRGTGKSIFALNITRNYFHKYDCSVVFFSIEMPKTQVNNRLTSIISGVPNSKITKGLLNEEDHLAILRAKIREFYDKDDEVVKQILAKMDDPSVDPLDLDGQLKYAGKLDKQFFIVDDPTLSISKIDYYLSLLKQKSKAPILAICVDYLNILNDPEANSTETDWKVQDQLSRRLKTIARQHKAITFAPNQIDQTGKARFAVAIEDHIDCAFKFLPSQGQKKSGVLPVFIDKMRDGRDDFDFELIINKETLALENLDEHMTEEEGEEYEYPDS